MPTTVKEEILIMNGRINSVEDKLNDIDNKLDMITSRLLDPDNGVTARVNKNTSARKTLSRALWVLYTITIGLLITLFIN